MNVFKLELTPPFNPELSLGAWLRSPNERIDLVNGDNYQRLFFRDRRPLLLGIKQTGTIDNPSCEISLSGEVHKRDKPWAENIVRWMLHDHAPLEDFYKLISSSDNILADLTKRLRGLRPVLSPTPFETLVFAIVGQQINLAFAYTLKASLEERFSGTAVIEGKRYYAGLTPEDFVSARKEELREMKISNSKARTILDLAAFLRKKPLHRTELASLSFDDAIASLTSHWGIGRWTAEYTLLKASGAQNSLPAGDAGLQNAVRLFYNLQEKPNEDYLRQLAERWQPYCSLATIYLWTGLGLKKTKTRVSKG